ncbi:MAG: hypothetical protein VR76_14865 [Pseudomonas sp. BRH_c35]|nr:MAG: hypothetical protein VR76_14865 [Pseudomonas sp. BRH_c35]
MRLDFPRQVALAAFCLFSASLSAGQDDQLIEQLGDRLLDRGSASGYSVPVGDGMRLLVTQSFKTYPVSGYSWTSVMASLRRSPLDVHGSIAYGLTRAGWKWTYQVLEQDRLCAIHGFDLALDLVVVLPELVRSRLAPEEMALWKEYADGVAQHERIHAQDALDVGVRLLKTLAEMPGAASCSDLQKQVEGVHAREMEWFQARAAEVDAQRMGFPARFR